VAIGYKNIKPSGTVPGPTVGSQSLSTWWAAEFSRSGDMHRSIEPPELVLRGIFELRV